MQLSFNKHKIVFFLLFQFVRQICGTQQYSKLMSNRGSRPIFAKRSLTRSLQNTQKLEVGKKNLLVFENSVVAGQYLEYVFWPEVSPTPGSGCFGTSQTDTQTNGHWDSMTELAKEPIQWQFLHRNADYVIVNACNDLKTLKIKLKWKKMEK